MNMQTKNGNGGTPAPVSQGGAVAVRRPSAFELDLQEYRPQIAAALPSHISLERFTRVVVTAVNTNPELAKAERRSLFNSCVRAANDGLLPDGRDGALVIFNTKVKKPSDKPGALPVEVWEARVQWMPMIQGILKRARNTGELESVAAHVVYEKDGFRYTLGDEEMIEHQPYIGADRGKPVGAYAIAKLKDGMIQREFMSVSEIEKVRSVSRAKTSGPWVTWWDEMARKTVARRMFKWLPTSADLASLFDNDQTIDRDEPQGALSPPPRPTRAEFPDVASEPAGGPAEEATADDTTEHVDPETGEISAGGNRPSDLEDQDLTGETGDGENHPAAADPADLLALASRLETDMMAHETQAELKAWFSDSEDVTRLRDGGGDFYADLLGKVKSRMKTLKK